MGKIIIIMFIKTNITVQNEVVERNKTLHSVFVVVSFVSFLNDEVRLLVSNNSALIHAHDECDSLYLVQQKAGLIF